MSSFDCCWCEMSLGGELCAEAQVSGKCPVEEAVQEQEDRVRYDEAMSFFWREWQCYLAAQETV